jgi:hypothetical protein
MSSQSRIINPNAPIMGQQPNVKFIEAKDDKGEVFHLPVGFTAGFDQNASKLFYEIVKSAVRDEVRDMLSALAATALNAFSPQVTQNESTVSTALLDKIAAGINNDGENDGA